MIAMLLATATVASALGPFFKSESTPPKAFTGNATLPGVVVKDRRQLIGSWAFGYEQREAKLESGYQGALHSVMNITFRDNGTYELHYSASWDFAFGSSTTPVPTIGNPTTSRDGITVDETGKYSLSGEIVLFEPTETRHTQIKDSEMVKARQKIANENRALLLRIDGKRLNLAGRCAKFQIEPICREKTDVWFQLTAPLGRRWLGL